VPGWLRRGRGGDGERWCGGRRGERGEGRGERQEQEAGPGTRAGAEGKDREARAGVEVKGKQIVKRGRDVEGGGGDFLHRAHASNSGKVFLSCSSASSMSGLHASRMSPARSDSSWLL
jgi:hypothetical protein